MNYVFVDVIKDSCPEQTAMADDKLPSDYDAIVLGTGELM